jgi:hypothetical protein
VLSDAERAQAEAAVARLYSTFTDIFAYLADRVSEALRDEPPADRSGARAAPVWARGASDAAGWFAWLARVARLVPARVVAP